MKVVTSFAVLLFFTHILSAQTSDNAKDMVAGGYLSFNTQHNTIPIPLFNIAGIPGFLYSSRDSELTDTYFNFTSYVGKEVSPHWLLGIQLVYAMERYKAFDVETFGQTDTVDLRRNDNQYGLGLFGRFMINPESKFIAFIQPNLNFSYVSGRDFRDETETGGQNTYSFSLGASGGVLYEISDHFRLTSRIGVLSFTAGHWEDTESDEGNNFTSFGTTLNFSSLSFGFEYKF
ncbi:MAG: hypothetical protein IPL92_01260 [Saprospiraceae bacterium]|nr:hypothetical protein [Candidatus Opimibacter iunctus]